MLQENLRMEPWMRQFVKTEGGDGRVVNGEVGQRAGV